MTLHKSWVFNVSQVLLSNIVNMCLRRPLTIMLDKQLKHNSVFMLLLRF